MSNGFCITRSEPRPLTHQLTLTTAAVTCLITLVLRRLFSASVDKATDQPDASPTLSSGDSVTPNTAQPDADEEPQPFTRSVGLASPHTHANRLSQGSPYPALPQLSQDESGIRYSAPGQRVRISFGNRLVKSGVQLSNFARSNTGGSALQDTARATRGTSGSVSGGALANTITFTAPTKPAAEDQEGTTRLDLEEEGDVSTITTTNTDTTVITTTSEAETTTTLPTTVVLTTVPTTVPTTKASVTSRVNTRIRFRPIPRRPFRPSFPSVSKEGIRHLGFVSLRPKLSKPQDSDIKDTAATDASPAEEDKDVKLEEVTSLSQVEEEVEEKDESTTEAAVVEGVTK